MNEGLVVVVRSVIGFFSLLIFTRIIGKEQISQLTFFDYVLGITIGSIAASLTTDLSAEPGLMGRIISLGCLGLSHGVITTKVEICRKVLEGEPDIIIMNGKILEKSLKKAKYRASDILELLRNQGIFNLNEVATQ